MARIRTIKPEFWEDEVVGSISREARLLFLACLNIADDEGLLRWSAAYIKSSAFMYDEDVGIAETQRVMDELTATGMFHSYRAGKSQQPFAYVVGFQKHQKINRPSASRLPPPPLQRSETADMYRRRDGGVCHLCGGDIDDHAGGHDDFLISLDHIVPVSSGGTDHPSNIRAAHQTCNKGRGNRTIEQYKKLLLQGRTNAQARHPDRFSAIISDDSRNAGDGNSEASPPDLVSRTLDQSLPSEGADAPLKERIFGPALDWLAKQSGKPKDKLRPLVGRWCSKHGDGATLEALAAAAKNAPLDPIPYIERVLKPKAPNGKPDAQASASAHLEGLASIFGTQPMATDRSKPVEQGRVIDGDFRTVGSPEAGDGPGIYPGDGGTDRVRGGVRDSVPRAEGGSKNIPRGTKAPAGRPHSSGRVADQGDVGVGQSDADASGPSESGEGGPCGEGDASRAGEGGEIEGPRNIGVKERDCPGEVGSLAASARANDEQPDFDPVADMHDAAENIAAESPPTLRVASG